MSGSPGDARAPGLGLALAALGLLLVASAAVWVRVAPPAALPLDVDPARFSGERARARLEQLLVEEVPHPVGSAANARVRERLLAALRGLGLTPTLQATFAAAARSPSCAQVVNVLARIPAAPGAAVAHDRPADAAGETLLLVAHYDSVAAGPGANDDGAGVSVLLEVARALVHDPPPRPVLLLFTDGEEAGLLGAEAFVREPHPALAEVGAVINVEARGSRGPSLMFQTGPRSGGLVERFARVAPRPFTGSTFTTVYQRMPNDTDLSPFVRAGLPGLNLAFIGGVEHYHTAQDDLQHVDPRSLQHHGDNVLALARSLTAEGLPPPAADPVFFDVLGLVVISWPAAVAAPLAALALLGVAAAALAAGLRARRLQGEPGEPGAAGAVGARLALGVAAWAAATAAASLAVAALAWLLLPPNPWPASPGLHLLAHAGVALTATVAVAAGVARLGAWTVWGGVWLGWSGVALVLAVLLPGVSYALVAPSAVAAAAGLLALPLARRWPRGALALATLAPLALAALLLLETTVLMRDALGLPSALLLAPTPLLLALLLAGPLLPALATPGLRGRRPALLLLAAGLTCVAGVAAARAPAYTPDRRLRSAFVHHEDLTAGTAEWWALTFAPGRPPFLDAAPVPFGPAPRRASPWLARPAYVAPAAPAAPAEGAGLELRQRTAERLGPGRWRVRGRLVSPSGWEQAYLALPPQVTAVAIEGRPVRRSRAGLVRIAALPPEGARLDLVIAAAAPVELTLAEVTFGLPGPVGEALLRARQDGLGTPTHRGDLTARSRVLRLAPPQ